MGLSLSPVFPQPSLLFLWSPDNPNKVVARRKGGPGPEGHRDAGASPHQPSSGQPPSDLTPLPRDRRCQLSSFLQHQGEDEIPAGTGEPSQRRVLHQAIPNNHLCLGPREQAWQQGLVVRRSSWQEPALGVAHKLTAENNFRQTELFIVRRLFISPHLLSYGHKIMPNIFKKCSQAFLFPPVPYGPGLALLSSGRKCSSQQGVYEIFYLLSLRGVLARY